MEQLLGVLGGMGPQATQTFYQRVLDRTDARGDQDHVNALIFSDAAMPDRTQAILAGHTREVGDRLLRDAKVLEAAGCTLLAMTCNTAHYFADQLQEALSIPLLHMPRLAAAQAAAKGWRQVAVLSTQGTVTSGIYQRECAAVGLTPWTPGPELQGVLTSLIYDELKRGQRGSEEKFAAVDAAVRAAGCDGAILGCTELSVYGGLHHLPAFYLDAMDVLAETCVLRCGKRLRPKGEETQGGEEA